MTEEHPIPPPEAGPHVLWYRDFYDIFQQDSLRREEVAQRAPLDTRLACSITPCHAQIKIALNMRDLSIRVRGPNWARHGVIEAKLANDL